MAPTAAPVLVEEPPFTSESGDFNFYPQLKFYDLAGHGLSAMDEGITLQKS